MQVETIQALDSLKAWGRRYRRAVERNPEAESLKPMLDVIGYRTVDAFKKGATLDEVAEAVGLR